jgi:2,4-dienoyl-CoA reductase-like NADH-dependent reductase (Old Yellow Enzyme family)
LRTSSNHRTDKYGGSVENRARLMLEAVDAVAEVWGPGRVGMHLSPRNGGQVPDDANPSETFGYVARELGKRKIAFLMAREYEGTDWIGPTLKEHFGGVYITNEKFTKESADAAIERGDADAVAFGVPFIANPDLVERFKKDAELNAPNPAGFYSHGPEGYTDYPTLHG